MTRSLGGLTISANAIVPVMSEALPLRIFLASPGDLEDERACIHVSVEEHNARRGDKTGFSYKVIEWDQRRGTARRAQEAINELIAESHFMIVLFKGAWGSEPGSPWGYTSGTEEELFTGLLELGQADRQMRDVWVGFVNHANPNERVAALRNQIIERHSMMFESIGDLRDLKDKVAELLLVWEELAGSKTPRHVDLLPSSGKDVLRAANLRIRGEKLIELGESAAGLASLEEAAILGGPGEHLAYARALRHARDLGGAHSEIRKAIQYFADGAPLYSTLAADAFSAQAKVYNAEGRHPEAIGTLQHALTLVDESDAYSQLVRARTHDDLGLAYSKVKDLTSARTNFEEALEIRRDAGLDIEVCQSLINLARLEVAEENLLAASERAHEVVERLKSKPQGRLHANARVLLAQVSIRLGVPADGIPHAEWALAINRQLGNKDGEAIALLLLAQCCRSAGRADEARQHAQACRQLNEWSGNSYGIEKAQWILDRLAEESGASS